MRLEHFAPGGYRDGEVHELAENTKALYNSREPAKMLANLESISIEAAFILKDFHRHMDDPTVVRRLRDVGQKFATNRRTVILTGPRFRFPPNWQAWSNTSSCPCPTGKGCGNYRRSSGAHVESDTLQRDWIRMASTQWPTILRGLDRRGSRARHFAGAGNPVCVVPGDGHRCTRGKKGAAPAAGDAGVRGGVRHA